MKKNILLLLTTITIITVSLLTGCSNPILQPGEGTEKDSKGEVQFSWSDGGQTGSRSSFSRANTIQDARKVIISIEAADGTTVYSRKELNLFNFNGSFISAPLSLKVGSYRLTEYLVLDQAGTVIFATPKEGSKEANMVTDPLPINFTVTKDSTTKVIPEVVNATAVNPADFGYTTFSIAEAKLFNFQVAVMIYDAGVNNFITTEAQLDVTSDTNSYSYTLTNSTNNLTINDVTSNYTLTVKKAGYEEYRATYTNAQLKAFFQNPLVVNLSTKQAPVNNSFSFMLAVNIYDASSDRFIMTDAALDVTSVQKSYSYNLAAATNNITVDDITGSYTLTIKKEGYKDYIATYTATELKAFMVNPLVVPLTKKQAPGNSTFNFLLAVKIYDATRDTFILTDAALDVTGDQAAYNFALTNQTNTVTLNDVAGSYTLRVTKAGYEEYRVTYTDVQLKNFSTNPLQVVLTKKLAPVNNIIRFTDPGLEAVVRAEIKKPTGDIYTYDIITVTNLNASSKKIANLSGLENLTSLTTLNLQSNSITDISALSGLTELTVLHLGYNNISDITPLAGLTKLTTLTLIKNSITNISVLSSKSELTTLNLNSNNIGDITSLVSLVKLQKLDLAICGITDVSPLSSLTNLTELQLYTNSINNITPLSALTSLRNLSLASNDITDIVGLSAMKSLTTLNIGNNRVRELTPLTSLTRLSYLNLINNNIIEITPLVKNSGIGRGDTVYLGSNPLNANAGNIITTLKNRGATVN